MRQDKNRDKVNEKMCFGYFTNNVFTAEIIQVFDGLLAINEYKLCCFFLSNSEYQG